MLHKKDLDVLERIFEDDIRRAVEKTPYMPTQIKGMRVEALEACGYVRRAEARVGSPPCTVSGWALTALGHMTYCMSVTEDPSVHR